jgi:hypothetical protein
VSPYVKYKGAEARDVPDLRLIVEPNHTYEVPTDQLDGLLCQVGLWEKSKKTESAPEAEPVGSDPDLMAEEATK